MLFFFHRDCRSIPCRRPSSHGCGPTLCTRINPSRIRHCGSNCPSPQDLCSAVVHRPCSTAFLCRSCHCLRRCLCRCLCITFFFSNCSQVQPRLRPEAPLRPESPLRPPARVATDRYCDLFRAQSLAQLWSVWGTPTHPFDRASRDCDCGQ